MMHVIDRGARLDVVGSNREKAANGDQSVSSDQYMDRSQGGWSSARDSRRPRLIIHAPIELLVGLAPATEAGVAEIAGLGPVETDVLRRLACDAEIDLSVESREGCILDQGRARRDPTTAQRIEIARRDKGCRFPGCNFTEFTDVHHIRHWVKGGETNLDNLVTLCDRHHKAVHELGWSLVGNPNTVLSFTSPRGMEMKSTPSPIWQGGTDAWKTFFECARSSTRMTGFGPTVATRRGALDRRPNAYRSTELVSRVIAACGDPASGVDRDRHAPATLRAEAWRIEVTGASCALGKRSTATRAVLRSQSRLDFESDQMAAESAPIGILRSSSI